MGPPLAHTFARLRSIAQGECPEALRAACEEAVHRAAACKELTPSTDAPLASATELMAWLSSEAVRKTWCEEGALVLRVGAVKALALEALLAQPEADLDTVVMQHLFDDLWTGVAEDESVGPARFASLSAEVDAAIDAALDNHRSSLPAALTRELFVEALCEGEFEALYAPLAPCERLSGSGRATMLDTDASPLILVHEGSEGVELEVQEPLPETLHPWAGVSLSALDAGILGVRRECHSGTSLPVLILSSAGGSTPMHCEDWLLSSYNLNLSGAAKVWYVLPSDASVDDFLSALAEALPPPKRAHAAALLGTKRMRVSLPAEALRALGARRFVQQPGDIVLTAPGHTFHWTTATGFCAAESCNFMPHGIPMAAHAAEADAWLERVRTLAKGAGQELRSAMGRRVDLEGTLREIVTGEAMKAKKQRRR